MNKKVTILALAAVLTAGFTSCNKSNDEPEIIIDPVVTLSGQYIGWTLGSNAYAPYIPSEGDALTITVTNDEQTRCTLTYTSETWGTATINDVAVTVNDTAFIFSKPVTATIREDHSDWDFTDATGTAIEADLIAMPNRNPQGGGVTIKNYPIVLTEGYMSRNFDKWKIDFKAYLVPRSEHTMTMSFRNGKIPGAQ